MDKQIIFIGDIHGEFSTLRYLIHQQQIRDTIFIQVGDFGIGFASNRQGDIESLNRCLDKFNCELLAIRGNHDNPAYFTNSHPYDCSLITFVEDYTVKTINGLKFLFVGGAVSVDRCNRVLNESYWLTEEFELKLDKLTEKEFDVVVTHTIPAQSGLFLEKKNIRYWLNLEPNTLNESLDRERARISELHDNIKTKLWVCGHFHESAVSFINGVRYKCCDINEFYQLPYQL